MVLSALTLDFTFCFLCFQNNLFNRRWVMRQTLQSRKQCELLKSFLWIAAKLLVNVIPGKEMAVKMLG